MPSTTNRQTSEPGKKQAKPNTKLNSTPQSAGLSPLGGLSLSTAIENPDQATPESIVRLQRAAGNRAVGRLLDSRSSNRPHSSGPVQFKLTVGPAGDKYEQEADQVAERVLRMPAPTQSAAPTFAPDPLQREMGFEEEKEPGVQREFELHNQASGAADDSGTGGSGQPTGDPPPIIHRFSPPAQRQADSQAPTDPRAGFDTDSSVEHEINSRAGSGKPLPDATRSFMEPRFGADLGNVRVHTDPGADKLNRQLSAQAFTHGSDIYFGNGKYNPGTTSGDRLLAHELTHVVQQGATTPVRRKVRRASGKLVQRALTAESARAFDSAAAANPKYEDGRKLVNKYATPSNEPDPSQPPPPAPWQTMVTAELADDNVTSGEQDQINKTGRTHGLKFWKKSDEQEKKLKDFVRAFMLWDFASRTNQLRPEDTAKYGKLPAPKKLEKRKAYMSHAKPFQEKFKGLVEKGPSAPETQAFLQQEKFLDAMSITDKQQEKAKAIGPRIEVRSTFIGGPILGINLRAHLFIVYTGRDGKQFYFRGGPGENLDPDDPTTNGYTTADYGEYTASTIDYDPSAPSVTVLQGDAAEAKLDAMIEAAKAVNSMRVPYQAQIETPTQKKFRKSKFANKFKKAGDFLGEALGIFGTKGENCNRAAYTILSRAGVPIDKPMGKHPGWGAILGADTPGKENAMPGAETDDPSATKKYTLDAKHDIAASDGTIQVYLDRMFFQKSDTLADGSEVEQLTDEVNYRKIKYGDGKVGYIAKRTNDAKRTLRMRLKAALIARNWYVPGELDDMGDEINNGDFGRVLTLLQDVNLDRDYATIETLIEALGSLITDFGKPGNKLFKKRLDAMSEAEIRNLKHDYTEMRGLIDETGAEIGEAVKMVDARIGELDRRDKVMTAIGEMLVDNLQINLWVNHYPNYSTIHEIAKNANDDFGYVLDTLDSMRSEEVKGHFIEEIFDQLSYEKLKTIVQDPGGSAPVIEKCSEWLGVPEQFFIRRVTERYEKKKEKRKLAKEQEELRLSELAKLNKGYSAKDYPAGKHKWQLTEPTEVTVAATPEGPANIKYLIDPNVMMPRVAISDEWTTQYGRGRLEHNGKNYYIDLATVFGPPKSAKKKEEEPKSTSPFEGLLTPPKDKPIDFFEFSGTSEIEEPTRIKIIDEDYKDRDEWAHTFIMIGGRRAGNVYAGDLVKYFKSDAEASGGGDKEDDSVPESGTVEKTKPPLTEHFKAGKYPWPWKEPVTLNVSGTKEGPLDTERTFQPNGKYMQVSIFDDMTLQYGRCLLFHNGGMYYVSLEEAFGLPEDDEEVLDEDVVADTPVSDEGVDKEPDLDDQLEDDEDNEPPVEDTGPEVDEETDELPINPIGISSLEVGADLQDMIYGSFAETSDLKKLNPLQLAKLAKIMGKSVEDVQEQIRELI